MRGAAAPLLGYAVLIGVAAAVQWVWSPYRLPAALLGGAAVGMAVIAAAIALGAGRAGGGEPRRMQAIPDYSFSTVAVALAVCTMVVGAYLGLYLILLGGGILVLGLGGLVREARAERRSLRAARRRR